jgi:hypothetical protein
VHRIYEGEDPDPIVMHTFYGDTYHEVEAVYAAHQSSDRFLRDCNEKGCFEGKVPCRTDLRVYGPPGVTGGGSWRRGLR